MKVIGRDVPAGGSVAHAVCGEINVLQKLRNKPSFYNLEYVVIAESTSKALKDITGNKDPRMPD